MSLLKLFEEYAGIEEGGSAAERAGTFGRLAGSGSVGGSRTQASPQASGVCHRQAAKVPGRVPGRGSNLRALRSGWNLTLGSRGG